MVRNVHLTIHSGANIHILGWVIKCMHTYHLVGSRSISLKMALLFSEGDLMMATEALVDEAINDLSVTFVVAHRKD